MKYNININQLALCELSDDLDITDASILDYIIVMCNSLSEKIENMRIKDKDGLWTWIDLGSLVLDMPLLRLNSRTSISTRIQKIEKNGFVKTQKKRIKGHIYLYVKLDRKVDSLYVKLDRPVRETGQGIEKPVRETGPIINTSNIILNTRTLSRFDEFWDVYPSKKAKSVAQVSWSKIDPSLYDTIIADVSKRRQLDRQWQNVEYIPHPSTYLNQKRWTDDITPSSSIGPKLSVSEPYTKGKFDDFKAKEIN